MGFFKILSTYILSFLCKKLGINKENKHYLLNQQNPKYVFDDYILRNKIADIKIDFFKVIDNVYKNELTSNLKMVNEILKHNSQNVQLLAEEERAFPGNLNFLDSGYSNIMLKRYFFSGSFICRDKVVLDTCCGFGWGTYIVSKYAKNVLAFDLDSDVISFCKKQWDESINIEWAVGNALKMDFVDDQVFDIALAMETIEHFRKEDGEFYIEQISKKLKTNGIVVGTSAFPSNRIDADQLCSTNKYHLYVFTNYEMNELLKKHFKEHVILNNWMFIARK